MVVNCFQILTTFAVANNSVLSLPAAKAVVNCFQILTTFAVANNHAANATFDLML